MARYVLLLSVVLAASVSGSWCVWHGVCCLMNHVSTLCPSFLQRWSAVVGVSGTVYVA